MPDRGRPAYQPSDKDRRIAEALAGWAIPQERIARVIGVDPKTLRKHFAGELDVDSAKLEAQLAQNLLRIAQGHDRQALIATIFALKSRFGWVEASPHAREQPRQEGSGSAARRGDSQWRVRLGRSSQTRASPSPCAQLPMTAPYRRSWPPRGGGGQKSRCFDPETGGASHLAHPRIWLGGPDHEAGHEWRRIAGLLLFVGPG